MSRGTVKDLDKEVIDKWFKYEPSTGEFFWRESPNWSIKVGSKAGFMGNGYTRIQLLGKTYMAHRLAWTTFYGTPPKKFIDHIDRDRNNNRIENLRDATHIENMANIAAQKNNRCGLKGAHFHKGSGKYRGSISRNGKKYNLGSFATAEEAHAAYLAKEIELKENE